MGGADFRIDEYRVAILGDEIRLSSGGFRSEAGNLASRGSPLPLPRLILLSDRCPFVFGTPTYPTPLGPKGSRAGAGNQETLQVPRRCQQSGRGELKQTA